MAPRNTTPPLTLAQQSLAATCFNLAYALALRVAYRTGTPRDDLISEAMLALVKVAAWYDPARGASFSALAGRGIMQRLQQYVERRRLSHARIPTLTFSALEAAYPDNPDYYNPQAPEEIPPPSAKLVKSILLMIRRRVTARDWKILRLRYWGDLSCADIGVQVGMSKAGVQDVLRRVAKKMSGVGVIMRAAEEVVT